ncbi:uncharacterized protein (DUF2345 family), partial [Chitinivorax tropicus]
RIAEWLAGPNWGSHFSPRLGDEVMVDFLDGDPDRPLVIGSLHNEQDLPPFSAGEGSRANHPGTLSGYHGRNLTGSGYTRWVLDDTPGQLRTQLATSQLQSELNLGYLIQQPPHSGWRGAYRGQGFELRTDGWGTLRGHQGLLLTTHARQAAHRTQLDTTETRAALQASTTLARQLSQTATTHQALPWASQPSIDALHRQLSEHSGPVHGQAAQQPDPQHPSGRQLKDPVETFDSAISVLSTPTALVHTTPASLLSYSGQDTQSLAHGDQQLTAHHTLGITAGSSASLFTHHGGLKVIAAKAPVTLQAHDDTLQLISNQALTLTSSQDEIRILAQDQVTLFGGGAEIELKGGNITFKARGKFEVKAASIEWDGPGFEQGMPVTLPMGTAALFNPPPPEAELNVADPTTPQYDEQFVLLDPDGQPMKQMLHQLSHQQQLRYRQTKQPGTTDRVLTPHSEPLDFKLAWDDMTPSPRKPGQSTPKPPKP